MSGKPSTPRGPVFNWSELEDAIKVTRQQRQSFVLFCMGHAATVWMRHPPGVLPIQCSSCNRSHIVHTSNLMTPVMEYMHAMHRVDVDSLNYKQGLLCRLPATSL